MIYEGRVKNERQRLKFQKQHSDGIKEWYHFTKGIMRSSEMQIYELVVGGCKLSDGVRMMKAVVDFWVDIGGMNESLVDEESVDLQIGEYELQIEKEITCEEIEKSLEKVNSGKASSVMKFHMNFISMVVRV
ncbi:hypothetical protein FHG87_025573 [Trinorchestia longiramus]|nr:hypothetical protein FHG87_025573 [Trinorchestia longiramus]